MWTYLDGGELLQPASTFRRLPPNLRIDLVPRRGLLRNAVGGMRSDSRMVACQDRVGGLDPGLGVGLSSVAGLRLPLSLDEADIPVQRGGIKTS